FVFFIPSLKTKTGICLLQDGNQEPFKVRLHLAKDILMIQEQDVICVSGEPFYSGERTVTIRRQTVGGFGLSIKGGAEHNIPVVVSKISKEQRAELSGLLFIGDAILQINGINVRKCRHEEVVSFSVFYQSEYCLSAADCRIILRVWLGRDLNSPSIKFQPPCHGQGRLPLEQVAQSPVQPDLQHFKRWGIHSFSRQPIPGFSCCHCLFHNMRVAAGILIMEIHCCETVLFVTQVTSLKKHNNYIIIKIKKINRNFPVNQQIVYMGWTEEREQDSLQDRMYTPKFLALRGSSLYKFIAPPVTTWDWTRAEKTFSVYEIMCKILKDSDLLDRRKHCFSVQSESGEDLYFSVELESDLTLWEKAFQTATFLEVERIQCKTYACVLESHLMGLTIDFSMGFVCFDAATKAVLWRYKFSQLKGSSDDGKSKIKFLFQNQDTKQIEAKELEFSNLFAVLHCIHSFFAAKVACLDPLYVGSQATASAAPTTSGTGKLKYTT
ncbi:SNTG1 protein, partial [Rostratula benghalensis]|nr:SNTG1 protein [Rostratula benghalensis]